MQTVKDKLEFNTWSDMYNFMEQYLELWEEKEKITFIGPSGVMYWYEFGEYDSERKEIFAQRWFRLAEIYQFRS